MNKSERIKKYESEYLQDYDFEKEMVRARQRLIRRIIEASRPSHILEVGCGKELLLESLSNVGFIERWVIVEPASQFYREAKRLTEKYPFLCVINEFMEDVTPNEMGKVDFCIVSGLLHEVADPEGLLTHLRCFLKGGGILHVNVPNAFSLHRQLAVEMGMINSCYEFSDRNRKLAQYRVFDLESLKNLLISAGHAIVEEGGYMLKPFSHAQMEKVVAILGRDVLDGLWKIGTKYPGLASEIYVHARATES